MKKIINNTMKSYNELLVQKKELENQMANLQREKDLKVDRINNQYESKIEEVIRTLNFVKNEIDKSKDFIKEN